MQEEHKTHKMLNIEAAYKETFDYISSKLSNSTIKMELMNAKDFLNDELKACIKLREEVNQEIERIYSEVIEKIKQRQHQITNQVNFNYDSQEKYYREKILEIESQIFGLDDLMKIENELKSLPKIGLLRSKNEILKSIDKVIEMPSLTLTKKATKLYKSEEDVMEISKLILRQLTSSSSKSKPIAASSTKGQSSSIKSNPKSNTKSSLSKCYSSVSINNRNKINKHTFGSCKKSIGSSSITSPSVLLPHPDDLPVSMGSKRGHHKGGNAFKSPSERTTKLINMPGESDLDSSRTNLRISKSQGTMRGR